MADTFDRFTEQARSALEHAAGEAVLHHHGFIGTEHLLVGVMVVGEGPAADALAELGLGAHGVREQLVRLVGAGDADEETRPALTPRAREAIVRAVDEANRRAHDYVGPEHLLLGLIRDEGAVSVAMCQRLGISREGVRRAIERRISRS